MVRETGFGNLIIRYSSYRPPKHSTFYEERKKTSKTSGFYAYTALHRFYLNPAPPPPYHISFNTLYAGHTFSIICLEPHTSAVAGPALVFYILNNKTIVHLEKCCSWIYPRIPTYTSWKCSHESYASNRTTLVCIGVIFMCMLDLF